jgi:hypothetical protein
MRTRMYGGVRGQGLAAPIYSISEIEVKKGTYISWRSGSVGLRSREITLLGVIKSNFTTRTATVRRYMSCLTLFDFCTHH